MQDRLQSVHPGIHSLLLTFTEEMKKTFGTNLLSLILYGSAAGKNFIPKRSNINLLMVLQNLNLSHLIEYKRKTHYWRKKGIVPPLICTKDFLANSGNVFPIEWTEIMAHHVLLHGENPFDFNIEEKDIRLQCEKEIKENLIRLRQAFLETEDSPQKIENLALTSLNSLFPVMRSILVLQKETSPPVERESLIRSFCEKNHLPPDNFLKIWSAKKGEAIPKDQMTARFEGYLNDLEEISKRIDQLGTSQ